MDKALIINADDLGLSKEINEGICSGIQAGVISDASLLVEAPHVPEALSLLEDIGRRDLGIHINLDVLLGWDLPGAERFTREEVGIRLKDPPFLSLCRDSARSQIEKFLDLGLIPTHADTHHHVHGFFQIFTIILELCREYQIPAMRYSRKGYMLTTRKPIPYDAAIFRQMEIALSNSGIFFCEDMVEGASLNADIQSFPAELVVHPSRGGDRWRVVELQTLMEEWFLSSLAERDIRVVRFKDVILQ